MTNNEYADEGGESPCMAHLLDEDGSVPGETTAPAAGPGSGDAAAVDRSSLATLVDQLADAVIVCDPRGAITYWNNAAERLFGWSAGEAIGQSLDLIIPEKQRRAHWDGYERVMASGETRYGTDLLRVPSLHADGERRSIAFTVTLMRGPDGSVSGIAAVVRDETERWAAERELRRRVAELDRT